MATLREWMRRLWGSLRRDPGDGQLEEELRLHLELAGERARRDGASLDEAQRSARLQAGGVAQTMEAMRDQRGFPWLDDLARDTRLGLRTLRRNPTFTLVALLTLSIGIGANTAIFSVVNAVLIKPLPYPDADRLITMSHTAPGVNVRDVASAPFLYFTEREQNRTLDGVGLFGRGSGTVTGRGEPELVRRLLATADVLPIIGIEPLVGRYFSPRDDQPGSPNTAVLTYGYWQRRFGGSPSAVGERIVMDGEPWEIIGVTPQRFRFLGQRIDVITPFRADRSKVTLGNYFLPSIGRLKPGVTIEQASADVKRLIPIAIESFPPAPGATREQIVRSRLAPSLRPLKNDVVAGAGTPLWVLMAAIASVLAIACANIATLVLVRTEGRYQELAIRAALGAGWGRIARGLLAESAVLSVASGALGVGVASAGLRLLLAMGPANLPRSEEIAIDRPALLFALGLALASGLLFGLLPVVRYVKPRFGTALRAVGRSAGASHERLRTRHVLVVGQVALAFVLLVGAGLMVRTFAELTTVGPGFGDPGEVQTLQLQIPQARVPDPETTAQRQREILDRIAAVPGVTAAAFISDLPMGGGLAADLLTPEGKVFRDGEPPRSAQSRFISPGVFGTLRMPLVAGRDLTWTDMYGKRPVVLVSQSVARREWGDAQQALGKRVRGSSSADQWREIVGVVGDVHDRGLSQPVTDIVYFPILGERVYNNPIYVWRAVTYAIRSPRTGTPAFLDEIRRAVWAVDSNLPLVNVRTMSDVLDDSLSPISFTLTMLTMAGTMALLLGVIGIYGVMAYAVSQRSHEMGIRLALGARPGELTRMVVRQGLVLTGIGVAIGLAAAMGLTRLMASLLYGISPRDPLTFAAVPVLLATAALLASYLPARRAAAVDPVVALRAE